MKNVLKIVSFASLALMLAAAIGVFTGGVERDHYCLVSLVGTAGWFSSVPLWMKRRLHQSE